MGDQKIASLGISVDRGVSMHGIALNIGTRLEDFDVIVPCGLDCSMTSMGAALSEEPDFSRVTEVFRDQVLQILP